MGILNRLYRPSLALLTDLYQVTMAFGYWKAGMRRHEAAFDLHFRSNPFGGGYTLAAGLASAVEYLERFRFAADDLEFLAELRGNDDRRLFEPAFLDYLGELRLSCDVDAVAEGTVVFPREPLLRIRGPIVECQLLETPLLNLINFQTLIATKASRVRHVIGTDQLVEFGLRRAQGIDGSVSASRAAYIGGADATSSLLAGKLLGIPVRGTHAHSWVMFFASEQEAFREYARALPNNCIFLVDTYDTLGGVRHAIEVGRELRAAGHEMIGIRLDSGDLAYLSIQARRALDEAGFPDAAIVASNELDERIIGSLKNQGARINLWGVGTRLVTGHEQPALGGVYKLTAVRVPGGEWEHRIKLSEQAAKVTTPGQLQVRRFEHRGEFVGDLLWDTLLGDDPGRTLVDPLDATRSKTVASDASHADLLEPVLRSGQAVGEPCALETIRARARDQLGRFHSGIKRFTYPHEYPVGLEPRLHELKTRLTLEARQSR